MVYILFTLLFKFHDGRILVGWNFPKYIYIYTRPTLFRRREEKKKKKKRRTCSKLYSAYKVWARLVQILEQR